MAQHAASSTAGWAWHLKINPDYYNMDNITAKYPAAGCLEMMQKIKIVDDFITPMMAARLVHALAAAPHVKVVCLTMSPIGLQQVMCQRCCSSCSIYHVCTLYGLACHPACLTGTLY